MGQQHILFLILGICVLGITASAGVIMLQSEPGSVQRQAIYAELCRLAGEARLYRLRSYEEEGGDGTFLGLTATPAGCEKLKLKRCTPHGEFAILKNGNSESLQLSCIGFARGHDLRKPIHMVMTVYADSMSVRVMN